jgi:hypothetical protein
VDDERLDRLLEDYRLVWVTSQKVYMPPKLDARILAAVANGGESVRSQWCSNDAKCCPVVVPKRGGRRIAL